MLIVGSNSKLAWEHIPQLTLLLLQLMHFCDISFSCLKQFTSQDSLAFLLIPKASPPVIFSKANNCSQVKQPPDITTLSLLVAIIISLSLCRRDEFPFKIPLIRVVWLKGVYRARHRYVFREKRTNMWQTSVMLLNALLERNTLECYRIIVSQRQPGEY